MLEFLLSKLKDKDVQYIRGFKLSAISTFKTGGVAAVAIIPKDICEAVFVIKLFDLSGLKIKIIGNCSNLLFADGDLDYAVMLTGKLSKTYIYGKYINAECGASLAHLSYFAYENHLCGLEELHMIPARLGGATASNAGAFGREMSDIISSVVIYDRKSYLTRTVDCRSLSFSYRNSIFKMEPERFFILSATVQLDYGDKSSIKLRREQYRRMRIESQPTAPSLGSTFKRPKDGYAGQMIDSVGLKGYRIGGAEVSHKHAGFIVNTGGATSKNYRDLMEFVQIRVKDSLGVWLEPEIEIF